MVFFLSGPLDRGGFAAWCAQTWLDNCFAPPPHMYHSSQSRWPLSFVNLQLQICSRETFYSLFCLSFFLFCCCVMRKSATSIKTRMHIPVYQSLEFNHPPWHVTNSRLASSLCLRYIFLHCVQRWVFGLDERQNSLTLFITLSRALYKPATRSFAAQNDSKISWYL